MNLVSTHLYTYSELYASYQYLVTLSVTQVDIGQHWAGKIRVTDAVVHGETDGQGHFFKIIISNEEIINQFPNSSSALRRLLMP
jgi:hypothetical protein